MPTETEPNRIIPLSQRQAKLPPRWRFWLSEISLGGVLMLILGFIVIGGTGWFALRSFLLRVDAMQTPALRGSAKVLDKSNNAGGKRVDLRLNVWFDFKGKYLKADTTDNVKWDQTLIGDTVPIIYHIGKEGDTYIEDWQPLIRSKQIPLPR